MNTYIGSRLFVFLKGNLPSGWKIVGCIEIDDIAGTITAQAVTPKGKTKSHAIRFSRDLVSIRKKSSGKIFFADILDRNHAFEFYKEKVVILRGKRFPAEEIPIDCAVEKQIHRVVSNEESDDDFISAFLGLVEQTAAKRAAQELLDREGKIAKAVDKISWRGLLKEAKVRVYKGMNLNYMRFLVYMSRTDWKGLSAMPQWIMAYDAVESKSKAA